ncbi:hypothetical protein QJS10_CPB17g01827 [Acorus calamus]|uniref:Protein transport protein SEC23 n=1 Tax=Acorus calamus TaxID=4465 RepID=A0AAV9CV22_ACOCL|nr:hypothetical protein QJS10_CPB17g01827 [Acorus calamus]
MADATGSDGNWDGRRGDDVRFSFDVWPRTKIEASKCVIPFAAVISPISGGSDDPPVLPYPPLRCKPPCPAALNPYCRVDFSAKIWICPFCFTRNHFPPHYAAISEASFPAELFPQYTSIEYSLPVAPGSPPPPPPVFVFVVDTCLLEEELDFAKSAVQRALGLIPEHALVGFVSFGTQAHVHEIGFPDLSKAYIFRGDKEITKDQVLEQLGLSVAGRAAAGGFQKAGAMANGGMGVAGHIVTFYLQLQLPQTGCSVRFMGWLDLFLIVSKDLSEPVRSHKDLDKDAAPHFHKAVKFYEVLAKQLVGVAEMKIAVERTGGLVVLAESFGHSVFKDSFKRVFEDGEQSLGLSFKHEIGMHEVFGIDWKEHNNLPVGYAVKFTGTLDIHCSKDIKIQGIIGPCTSLEKKGGADTVIGQGNTTSWKLCGLDRSTCLTVFFDISPSERSNQPGLANENLYIQFATSYQNPEGQMRLRVNTVSRRWVNNAASSEELAEGFDQETAAVVMARFVSLKMETEVFNNSPDETAYFRMLLNRENVTNSLVMIQPSLLSYSFNSPPVPTLLDVASIQVDRILLLDAYFSVVIFHGLTIAQWRNMGYQNQPEHQAFAQLLKAPQDDAEMIKKDRFPVPRLVVCDQHGSQVKVIITTTQTSRMNYVAMN